MPKPHPFKKRRLKIVNKKGLNAKEKAEVAKIAKNSVKTLAETKYMDNNDEGLQNQIPFEIQNNKLVSCIGYSTTVNAQPDGGAFQYPNGHNIRQMMCLRPFFNTTAQGDLGQYAPDGKEIRPISCRTRWRLDRDFTKITSRFVNIESGQDPEAPADAGLALPILCRMIRVNPILTSTSTECDPANDLFLNQYNQHCGVDSTDVNNDSIMNEQALLFNRVNTRRYKVLEDRKFVLQPGVVVNWTGAASSTSGRAGIAMVQPSYKKCEQYLHTNHMLTTRKGGKCYYEDPSESTTTNATTGNKREYILFHFMRQGGTLLTGDDSAITAPLDINIEINNLTKFIDI